MAENALKNTCYTSRSVKKRLYENSNGSGQVDKMKNPA
jgi:hypothetical protein